LVEPGALQWAPVHSGRVLAVAASGLTAVSVGADGYMKVSLGSATSRRSLSVCLAAVQVGQRAHVGLAGCGSVVLTPCGVLIA
jgi:hypothetical protein